MANSKSPSKATHSGVFRIGERVKWNYWTDMRESGWFFGTVIDGPIRINGILAYEIEYDGRSERGPFPAWKPAALLEKTGYQYE